MADAKPNLLVVKLPGLSGGPGTPGENGVSAVNNIVNPVLKENQLFNYRTEVQDLGYDMPPSASITFEATLILRGLNGSTAVVSIEGPEGSVVSAVITSPYAAAPDVSGSIVSFGISSDINSDHDIIRLSGTVKNTDAIGRVNVFLENIDEVDGGYIADGSFVQWSIPVLTVLTPTQVGNGNNNALTKEQADLLYPSRSDSRLSDDRTPKDRSVNSNKIAAGGLPISSIDQLRNELDDRPKTINGISPDSSGNIIITGTGGVSGLTMSQADARYPQLSDVRLTDQRIPIDNSVINPKVPNNGLDVSKINGLAASLDAIIAQLANLSARVQTIETNGASPGSGTPGTGYPAVYQLTY